jgi:hypothetical protein
MAGRKMTDQEIKDKSILKDKIRRACSEYMNEDIEMSEFTVVFNSKTRGMNIIEFASDYEDGVK